MSATQSAAVGGCRCCSRPWPPPAGPAARPRAAGPPRRPARARPSRTAPRTPGRPPTHAAPPSAPAASPGTARWRTRGREPGAEFGEAEGRAADVVGLGRGRPGQEREFLVRREQALPHQRGRRHLEVHRAEQRPVQHRLLGGHQVRRGRGQPDDPGLAELLDHRLQQPAPQLQKVVALVEHQRPRTPGLQAGDQSPPVRVQEGQHPLGAQPGPRALNPDGRLLAVARRAQRAQGLVGQHGQRGRQLPAGGGGHHVRAERRLPLRHPLGLDRRVGAQHHGGAAQPPRRLEPDQRLAAAGRHHQVGGAVAAGHVAVQRGQRADLVRPQRAGQADAVEHAGHPIRLDCSFGPDPRNCSQSDPAPVAERSVPGQHGAQRV